MIRVPAKEQQLSLDYLSHQHFWFARREVRTSLPRIFHVEIIIIILLGRRFILVIYYKSTINENETHYHLYNFFLLVCVVSHDDGKVLLVVEKLRRWLWEHHGGPVKQRCVCIWNDKLFFFLHRCLQRSHAVECTKGIYLSSLIAYAEFESH